MYIEPEDLCPECTGDGVMSGNVPCKICGGTGEVKQKSMSKKELELLDLTVFSNNENRQTFLDIMKIAFKHGAKGQAFKGYPNALDSPPNFEAWISEIKRKLDK